MITDSHCHLASHRFPPDEVDDLVRRAHAAGVSRMISLVTGLDDLDANLAIARRHPSVGIALGIHPCSVHENPVDAIDRFIPHLPLAAAIGETGLDYYHPAPEGWSEAGYHQSQRSSLDAHFRLAAEHGLNLVIHTRDRSGDASFRDALKIYEPYASRVRAVFHCFVGPIEAAREVLGLGGMVSFGGVITFRNAGDSLEAARNLPLESILLETDSPYLAPTPHRGKRNEPAFTRHVAEFLASQRGIPLEELASRTSANARSFFRI